MIVSFVLWSLCLLGLFSFSVFGYFIRRNPFLWTLLAASAKLWVHSKVESVRQYFRPELADDPLDEAISVSSSMSDSPEEGIDEPGDVCVMDMQHCPEYSIISYAYRHMQYRMVFGLKHADKSTSGC